MIPASVFSLLGEVPVSSPNEKLKEDNLLGAFYYGSAERRIEVRDDVPVLTKEHTLGHEIAHMVLHDSGLSNLVGKKLEEALCDSFGTWFAGAIQAGKLVLK